MPEQRVTIKDIARELNLSVGTVDRALNGRGRIKDETKRMILEKVEELGYKPNRLASALAKKKDIRISFVTPAHNPFWQDIITGARTAAAEMTDYGVEIEFKSQMSDHDVEGQIAMVEQSVQEGADGIILAACHQYQLEAPINRAVENHIPVITVNIDSPHSKRLCYVGENGLYTGSLEGDLFGRFMGGRGTIAMMYENVEISEIKARRVGFQRVIKSKYPDIEIVGKYPCPEDPQEACEVAKQVMKFHPDLRGFFADTVIGANAIGEAIKETGNIHKIAAVGYDTNKQIFDLLQENALLATVTQNPRMQGERAVKLLLRYIIEKERPENQFNYVPTNILLDRGQCE